MTEQTPVKMDDLTPPEIALKTEAVGMKKASLPPLNTFVLAVMAGIFIALGAVFATTVTAGSLNPHPAIGEIALNTNFPYGVNRLLAGLAFSVGLILVILGGAELFTGNTLLTLAWASRKVSLWQVVRNWLIVYFGNLAGSLLVALLIFFGQHYRSGGGAVGLAILNTGEAKTALGFVQALALGVLCNLLVCMAVWMSYAARSVAGKVLAIIPPITAFVAASFEHSVANMYFIPIALLVKTYASSEFFTAIGRSAQDFPHLTWGNFFLANLLPVTLGNIIGGGIMVGLVYWFVYLRRPRQ